MNKLAIRLVPGAIRVNGAEWTRALEIQEFEAVFGQSARVESKLNGGRPWRNIRFYDNSGVYALEDLEENRIPTVGFVFIPESAIFPTRKPFVGTLTINAKVVTGGMKLREHPLQGELNFVPGIGSTWKYVHDEAYVELNLKKTRTSKGSPVLVAVTHSFSGD
jgi:hypothetical protein